LYAQALTDFYPVIGQAVPLPQLDHGATEAPGQSEKGIAFGHGMVGVGYSPKKERLNPLFAESPTRYSRCASVFDFELRRHFDFTAAQERRA
jgi:hypothetical protein